VNQNKVEGIVPPPEGGLPPKGGKLRVGGGKNEILNKVLILKRSLGILPFFWVCRENDFKIKSLQVPNLIEKAYLKISRHYYFCVQKYCTFIIKPTCIPFYRLNQTNDFECELSGAYKTIGERSELPGKRWDHLKMGNGIASKMVKIKNVLAIFYDFKNHRNCVWSGIETKWGFWVQKNRVASGGLFSPLYNG
jgi:hypothetical protein